MGGFQHVYLSGQCGQIILLALPAHCPPHCTALPSVTIAHSQVTCEFASFVAEFISRSLFHSLVQLPSLSYFAMAQIPATRRELQQRSLPQLKALAEELALPSSGRKSAIIDRLYRHHRQPARDNGPTGSRSRSPSSHPRETQTPTRTQSQQTPAHLERTVQQLVDRSLQGLEERLLTSLRTLVPTASRSQPAVDNISLPSPQHQRPAGTTQGVPTHPTATAATLDVLPIAPQAAPSVQQPPLPDKVKQRIVKGEYIDFDMLLPESLYPTRHGVSPSPSFTLRLSDDPASVEGDVVIAQQKAANKRAIRDLPSWMEAWNVYIHVLVQHFPARAQALLAYQRIICDASVRFAPRCWLRYDQRFRASATADKTIRWDRKHNDLWLECFTQPIAQQHQQSSTSQVSTGRTRRPCTYCGSLYHYPENCQTNPFRAPRSNPNPIRSAFAPSATDTRATVTTPPNPPTKFPLSPQPLRYSCRDFNKGLCQRPACRFRHACAKCGNSAHGERDCPNSR